MAKGKYREKNKDHKDLLRLLRKHFTEDETEMIKEDMEEAEMGDVDHEGQEEAFGKEGEDDDYYEDLEGKGDEDTDKKLSKEKRKKLAVMVVSKRAGNKRKAM